MKEQTISEAIRRALENCMARFFFDTFEGNTETRDDIGLRCERDAVSRHAVDALPDIARDQLPDGPACEFWVKVRDEGGTYIFEASLTLQSRWLA